MTDFYNEIKDVPIDDKNLSNEVKPISTTNFGEKKITDSTGAVISDIKNKKIDTRIGSILKDIDFGNKDYAGGVYSGNITWNKSTGAITGGSGVLMYRDGIIGAASGVTTFYLDATTGDAYFSGELEAETGHIGGFEIGTTYIRDVANSFGLSSDVTGGDDVRFWAGDTYANRATAPLRLTEGGDIFARNGEFGGVLRGSTFKYDVISAVGGQLLVTNSDVLESDMTALDASTMTIKGNTTFAVNDILLIRNIVVSGIQEEYFRVTNISAAPIYTVTRDLAGAYAVDSNPAWKAGTTVVKIGASDGVSSYSGGWLRLFGEGTNAPYYSVFSRTGIAYNAYTERIRIGNLNGIGGNSIDTYGIFIGNKSTGQYMQYDDVSGQLIVNETILSFQDIFGDGNDGDVTISSNTVLTSDMYYNNLTVDSGKVLNPNGYRIFVKGTLTNNGIIGRYGQNGANGVYASNVAAGAAGGAALATGTIYGGLAGAAGGNSSVGTAPPAFPGGNGSNQTESVCSNGTDGGDGGASSEGNPGGAGGTGGTKTDTIQPVRNSIFALIMREFSSDNTVKYIKTSAGSGGGGGGYPGADTICCSGGGAGGSGGIVLICAKKIINDGTIGAKGGNGGNGGKDPGSFNAGGGGGGAGGSGGFVCLIYNYLENNDTITVDGGSGGLGGDYPGARAGQNGSNGNAGTITQLQI